ncbi:MAG: M56 family metallopeptidase [Aequorivita sp.]
MDYLLKASAVLAIFYFGYKLFIQRETFFNSNRWFLLSGLIIALFIPLIVIPIYIEIAPQAFNPMLVSDIGGMEQSTLENISLTDMLFYIYGLGTLFFFGKFTVNMLSLFNIICRNPSENSKGIQYIKTEDTIAPFSFFNWIVYNPSSFKDEELQLIINHERVHAKQWHSVDVIFSQLTCIVFWFNPIVWFYKKALQQNLEFIADQEAQSKTDCKQSYQRLLLKTSLPTHQLVIANNFYNSLIKKRIIMLHKSKSNSLNRLKYLLVIPALVLFLMSFNTKTVYVNNSVSQNINLNKTFTISAKTSNSELKDIESYFSNKAVKVKFASVKRNPDNTIKKITIKTNHDGGTNYVKRMTIGLDKTDKIKPFSLSLSDDEMDILVQTSEDVTAIVSKDKITFDKNFLEFDKKEIVKLDNLIDKDPLYIINGRIVTKKDLDALDPDVIQEVKVLKVEKAKAEYGDKGKNGVMIISTKDMKNKMTNIPEDILVIIDGKTSTKKVMDALNPNDIQEVNILKPEMAKAKYGNKGKSGAIIITTKA